MLSSCVVVYQKDHSIGQSIHALLSSKTYPILATNGKILRKMISLPLLQPQVVLYKGEIMHSLTLKTIHSFIMNLFKRNVRPFTSSSAAGLTENADR